LSESWHAPLASTTGDARIGIAISDALGLFAQPLETIHVAETEPLSPDRRVGPGTRDRYRRLGLAAASERKRRNRDPEGAPASRANWFRCSPRGLPWWKSDERLSTVTARERIETTRGKKRRESQPIDQVAAAVILQDYLDALRGPVPPPDPWEEDEE